MKIIRTIKEWKGTRKGLNKEDIGFVPTMGALHDGHASLLKKCREENNIVVLSIFLNPTQFNDKNDLNKYPKTWEQDIAIAEDLGVDFLFAPNYSDMYPDNFKFSVEENSFSSELCGANRPGHFTGVLTVVTKLLNLVNAKKAYFGEKDFQQYTLIKDMCEALFIDTQIISCPTVREEDGLAMSSRNALLNEEMRELAAQFHGELSRKDSDKNISEKLNHLGFTVDYIETHSNRRYGAVSLGEGTQKVRLIDNVQV